MPDVKQTQLREADDFTLRNVFHSSDIYMTRTFKHKQFLFMVQCRNNVGGLEKR